MFNFIRNIFRKRRINKMSSDIKTSFIPISDISVANIVINVEEPGFDELKESIIAWGRREGIRTNIFYFDFRKLGKDELLLTSIQTTIIKKELDWTGMPDLVKTAPIIEEKSDLFISLIDNADFPIDFLSKCAKARFKIGRHPYKGDAFDMIFSGGQSTELRPDAQKLFLLITEFLKKIR